MTAFPRAWQGGAGTEGKQLQWGGGGLPFGITQQWRSASLVIQASSTSIHACGALHSCLLRSSHSQEQASPWVCSPSTQRLSAVLITPRTLRWAGLGSAPCVHGPLWPAATPWLPCSPLTENEAPLLSRLSSRPAPVTGFP